MPHSPSSSTDIKSPSPAVCQLFVNSLVQNENITETEDSTLLTTRSIKIEQDQLSNVCDELPSTPVAKSRGYNLDFLEKCDDPNFNPFETKTNVVDDVDVQKTVKTETVALNCNNSSANFEDDKHPSRTLSEEATANSFSEQLPSPAKLSAVAISKHDDTTSGNMDCREDENLSSSAGDPFSPLTVPDRGYKLDFFKTCDVPDFDPFATKTKVIDDILLSSPSIPPTHPNPHCKK